MFADEVVPVPGATSTRDESIRAGHDRSRSSAKLKPAFRPDGTVTAGNASPLNDGAAALLLGDEAGAPARRRRSRWPGSSPAASPRSSRSTSASARSRRPSWRSRRAGIGWGDLAAVELNEAFAAQSLACLAEWPDLDPAIVNCNGGAIAIGHPLGCSGARILGHARA